MRNDVKDGIKNLIPRILFERKMSISDLSDRSGIPYATLYGIVNNDKKGVMFKQARAICDALGVDFGDLYEVAQ